MNSNAQLLDSGKNEGADKVLTYLTNEQDDDDNEMHEDGVDDNDAAAMNMQMEDAEDFEFDD